MTSVVARRNAGSEIPAPDEILARVRELQPLLARNSAQGEADRRVVEASITALTDAGVFKIAQPKRYGGYETSIRTLLDVSAAVGESDGGTAWAVTLLNVCAWMVGLFPEQAQHDVWGENPGAKVSGVLAPTSTSVRVDGGYRVTGRWYYNSGSWHADWAGLGIMVETDTDEREQAVALIPRTDLELEDTWFVAGMKASGSNCLVATDVFVPDHRILRVQAAIEGRYATEHTDEALYRAAYMPVMALVLAGPQLGLGRAALRIVTEKAATKKVSYTSYATQAESVSFQLQLAEAALLIDSAHLHAHRACDDVDNAARNGSYPDPLIRARVRADTGLVLKNITHAIDVLLSAHGAASFADANPLQRIWRDSAVAARHGIVVPQVNFEIYGKALLNRDDQIAKV
ncbi:acyl-CoA dehydrogenase family protein [Amycolatopsis pithecellobii]|uniref:Oxidoreductase n=1 Tax=Amycolatopsis pithecellobii TaxID=664692 RepID=A0A6N7Z4Y8_9PSEU|nr:oxidoreductase [Amycolatopsis pithecellobii]MTD55524.1 oxidoreductase [Amycolatopsis pithecellobii]